MNDTSIKTKIKLVKVIFSQDSLEYHLYQQYREKIILNKSKLDAFDDRHKEILNQFDSFKACQTNIWLFQPYIPATLMLLVLSYFIEYIFKSTEFYLSFLDLLFRCVNLITTEMLILTIVGIAFSFLKSNNIIKKVAKKHNIQELEKIVDLLYK